MLGFISQGLLIALLLIGAFLVVFGILDKVGILEKYNMELAGPLLMWKTERGKDFIENISKKVKFWENYGNFAIFVLLICMVLILFLVVWSAYLASDIPREAAPSPRLIIGIPGVNPLIPVWYGILGLAVAIIVHEFSHGILARVADIKVKTLGLVFLVVPVGAFVEPDEEEMEKLPKLKRDRIYAVGPTSNIILALVCALLFSSLFMASVVPRQDGVIVHGLVMDSPADMAGIERAELIIEIDERRIRSLEDIDSIGIEPGREVEVRTIAGEEEKIYSVLSGLVLTSLVPDYPADEAGLEEGDVLLRMDEDVITDLKTFNDILERYSADDLVEVVVLRRVEESYEEMSFNVTLADKYESFQDLYPNEVREEYRGEGYFGLGVTYMGTTLLGVNTIPDRLSRPFEGAEGLSGHLTAGLQYISLPFQQLSPLPSEITVLYEVSGSLSILPSDHFWIIANSLYWVFWLNLMVGLFNALPAVPLDGGFVFRDGLKLAAERLGCDDKKKEKIVDNVSIILALAILFMILWQLVGPYLNP